MTPLIIRVISNVMKHARNMSKKNNLQNEVKMKNKFVPHKITLSLPHWFCINFCRVFSPNPYLPTIPLIFLAKTQVPTHIHLFFVSAKKMTVQSRVLPWFMFQVIPMRHSRSVWGKKYDFLFLICSR
jgi:hypothetical protein